MNKKLQSMYNSGSLLKALLKDPAQAKMAMEMLGKQAKAAEGMAVNKSKLGMPGTAVPGAKNTYAGGGVAKTYRAGGTAMYANGGQNGPGRKRRGKKEQERRRTAKDAWQEAGYDREPVNWDRTTESTREAVYPKSYEGFEPMMVGTQKRGDVFDVNTFNADPNTAQQIAREVRSQMGSYDTGVQTKRGGLPAGVGRYQAVIPSVDDIVQALQTTKRIDLTNQSTGGQPITAMEYIQSGMQDYAGPDFHTEDMVPGRGMFDAILSEAMGLAQNRFNTELDDARGAKRGGGGGRDVRGGETKEEYAERADRAFYKPEMREYNLLDKYGDRLYESSYFGDEGYDQAQGQAQADIRNAVIDMLNEAAGSNIYDQYRGQTNKFL